MAGCCIGKLLHRYLEFMTGAQVIDEDCVGAAFTCAEHMMVWCAHGRRLGLRLGSAGLRDAVIAVI